MIVRLLAAVALAGPVAAQPDAPAPQWFKGNLHTHSLWSDGNDFPEMIAAWYKEHGYHFLALSDHNILSTVEQWAEVDMVVRRGGRLALKRYREQYGDDWVETRQTETGKLEVRLKRLDELRPALEETGRFLLVQAEEITDKFQQLPIHINATNLRELIAPQGGSSVEEVIRNNLRAVAEQSRRTGTPILAHLNHPNFGWGVTAEELAAVLEERFVEVYNGHPSVNHLGDEQRASVEMLWDIANTIRIDRLEAPPLFGLATDDSHNYHSKLGATSGRGWVMVRAKQLEPAALVTALEMGDFYASSGVLLDAVEFEDQVLRLRIAAVDGVTFTTRFIGTRRGYDRRSEPLRDAEGNEIRATRRYSDGVGGTLGVAAGLAPEYRLGGDELYVRAVVTASRLHPNPSFDGQREQAWTQPFGWR